MTNAGKMLCDDSYKQLDDYKLAAMLLSNGCTSGKTFFNARERLEGFKSSQLYIMDSDEFIRKYHLTEKEYLVLKVAFEMGKRCIETENAVMDTPDNIFRYVRDMGRFDVEHFRVIHLNSSKWVIGVSELSIGGIDFSVVDPKVVFKDALLKGSHSIALVHNHPSGNCKPSNADLELTCRMVEGGKLLGIEVIDHIIISKYLFLSLRRENPYLFK